LDFASLSFMTLNSCIFVSVLVSLLTFAVRRGFFVSLQTPWAYSIRPVSGMTITQARQSALNLDANARILHLRRECFARLVLATSPAMLWIVASGFAIFVSSAIQHPATYDLLTLSLAALVIALQYSILLLFHQIVASVRLVSRPAAGLDLDRLLVTDGRRSAILLPPFRPPQSALA
jgi:hypothetical protein